MYIFLFENENNFFDLKGIQLYHLCTGVYYDTYTRFYILPLSRNNQTELRRYTEAGAQIHVCNDAKYDVYWTWDGHG